MRLQSSRLQLRPWHKTDVIELFRYARDPRVTIWDGWYPHTKISQSRLLLQRTLMVPECYAITQIEMDIPIGCICFNIGSVSLLALPPNQGEIGYWLGYSFWGQGIVPEAVELLLAHGFDTLNLEIIWSSCFTENHRSLRIQEKCGFRHHRSHPNFYWPPFREPRNREVFCMTRDDFQKIYRGDL